MQLIGLFPASMTARRPAKDPRRAANVVLGAGSLMPGNGGIARVGRLVARVLADEARSGRLSCSAFTIDDDVPPDDLDMPAYAGCRSKWRFGTMWARAETGADAVLMTEGRPMRVHRTIGSLAPPCMQWIHGIEVWEGADEREMRRLQAADMLVANSAYTRDRAERCHGGFAGAEVCWLGTETDEPAPPREPDGPPTVLIVGRMAQGRDKGHAALIRCWKRVASAVPGAQLEIVGRGNAEPELQRLARNSGAASQIGFRGFLGDAALERLWNNADVFAMPSRGEGFGLVYAEAMRAGLPVVGSVHDAAPEINWDGETGFNVDLRTDRELTDALIDLLRNPERTEAMGRAGRLRWRERFSYSAFRERFVPLLERLLHGDTASCG